MIIEKQWYPFLIDIAGFHVIEQLTDIYVESEAEGEYLVFLFDWNEGFTQEAVPLHQFASQMKEYYLNYGRGYCIMSFIDFDGTWFANISGTIHKRSIQGQSEPEVIFKAGAWIQEQED